MARWLEGVVIGAVMFGACGKADGPDATAPATATAPPSTATTTGPAEDAAAPGDGAAPAVDTATDTAAAPAEVAALTGPDAHRPRVSPDGRRVVYESGPEGRRELMLVDIDGRNARPLAADPGDDREPSWAADAQRVVFSSNRGGGGYALYIVDVEGGAVVPVAARAKPGVEAREPSLSPLRYSFSVVHPDACTSDGAYGAEVESYEKLVYTRTEGDQQEIWFRSLNGKHEGRVSPAGQRCSGARYSGDGLSLVMTCGAERVVHDLRASWDASFEAALKAIGFDPESGKEPTGCGDLEEGAHWDTDACMKTLPRRYTTYAPAPLPAGPGPLEASGYATNQTLVLAAGPAGAFTRERTAKARWVPLEGPAGATGLGALDWAPDGASVVAEQRAADGTTRIVRVPTAYYLQGVKDLVDYPELWAEAHSERMGQHHFVVRAGTEKEFHTLYDKLMYAHRAPYVTADAMLQLVRDEISNLLQAAEAKAAEDLTAITGKLMETYATLPDVGANRFFATHFGVAYAILEAGAAVVEPEPSFPGEDDPEAPKAAKKTPEEQMRAAADAALDQVPANIRDEVAPRVKAALAHEGLIQVTVPGLAAPVPVDFTQMKARGHYAESGLAAYFVAMKWLGMVPLAVNEDTVGLVRQLQKTGVIEAYERVDQMVGAFMGQPVDVSVGHLVALLAEDAALLEPTVTPAAKEALKKKLGDLGVRGLRTAMAQANGEPAPDELLFMFFPLRLGADVPAMTALTHPAVPGRTLASALDPFAAAGVPAALRAAAAATRGEEWQAKYDEELAKLRGKAAPLATTDLYHAWLALLRTLAEPMKTTPEMVFATSDAWQDRQLSSALGGYAQLKHDAVLYAFQDMSVECDGGYPAMALVEQPIRPRPRGFVEPSPAFFAAAQALARRAYAVFSPDAEPTVANMYDLDGGEVKLNAAIVAEHLERIARLEVEGRPIPEADYEFLRMIGGTFEMLFLMAQSGGAQGVGSAREERGIALVTDIFTAVTQGKVRQIGIGRVDRMLVAVPDGLGERMTEGGVFGFYELEGDMADRLTDEQWHQKIVSGTLPSRPGWVSSFFEESSRPGAGP